MSVCLSEHDSCGGDVPVDVNCFLCHKIDMLGKTVKRTAVRLNGDTHLVLAVWWTARNKLNIHNILSFKFLQLAFCYCEIK